MKKQKKKGIDKNLIYILTSVVFVIGIGIGIGIRSLFPSDEPQFNQIRDNSYEYINPLIDFESVESTNNKDQLNIQHKLEEYIGKKNDSEISHISVYYKDLNSGGWIGIQEDERFAPASLLKVPVMLAMYKMGEKNPEFLNQKIVFQSQETLQQNILPEYSLESGKEYTLDELITQLIKYSDNTVLGDILEFLPETSESEIFKDLGITNPYQDTQTNVMTVKEYASFFRILYNASYLNKDMSTKALKLLSETSYEKGIRSTVPKKIKVAHKFGEREILGEQYHSQLHDCGIIYYPQKPYLLCIMTRGTNLDTLAKSITELSKIVYDIVDKEN